MNESRLPDYIDHILQTGTNAFQFVEGQSKEDFLADKRTQQAVFMSLIIIGEAATKVMEAYAEFTQVHSQIPWRSMCNMRNRMAHGYFDIDLNIVCIVWDTPQDWLAVLLAQLIDVHKAAGDKGGNVEGPSP